MQDEGKNLFYKTFFENSNDALMTTEPPEWRFTSGNPATIKMFRARDEADFVSHGPGDLSPERQSDGRLSSEKAKEMIETALRDGSCLFEWTHRRLDGEDFPATVLLSRMELPGRVLCQATVRDISEQKGTEEKLRESENRYATALNAINDGVWDWNVSSGEAFFSPNYYSLLGYVDKEFPANYASWKLLVSPVDIERVENNLQKIIEKGEGFDIDLRMKMKSGEWLWVSTRGKVVERDVSGKAIRMVGTLSDISKRIKIENDLKEKMEELKKTNDLMVERELKMVELKNELNKVRS